METFSTKIGTQDLVVQTGKLAKQANASVTVQYGGTVVLVAATASKEPREGVSFLPLTVEYQEKTYAAGKIPGGFFKREGRPSEKAILSARLIDRPIRPLFPKGFRNELQIMAIVLSHDGENDPDVLALIGASCALGMSDIPFEHLLGAVRVGCVDGEFVVNPTYAQLEESVLDLVVAAGKNGVIMIESGAKEVSEDLVLKGIEFAQKNIQGVIALQEKLIKKCGKKKRDYPLQKISEDLLNQVEQGGLDKIKEAYDIPDKNEREEVINSICAELSEKLVSETSDGYAKDDIRQAIEEIEKRLVRKKVLEEKKRTDGRGFTDIRSIACEIGTLPRTHGSGLFTRGQTQSLSVVTLGTGQDEQRIDALQGEGHKSFMLHYNFPSFSVGEVRPVRGPGRREIGHGALAEKSLKAVMPAKEDFPYTVRIVSEVLESNGSSSMATVCAGTLALMDAGVPISAPVSGIALGLVKEGKNSVILNDILGVEDHFGDMDFKVAGTTKGLTAVQMDLKIDGIDNKLLADILKQSKQAREHILAKITDIIAKPKENLSELAPRIVNLKIDPAKIGTVIGPGGKMIRKIVEETGATIDIEDDGTVSIASTEEESSRKAIEYVKALTEEPEVGKIYNGKVKRVMNFGAFCEILPGKEGLVHVSELGEKFVKNVEDVVKVGDEFPVKLVAIDQQGRLNLSKKQAMDGKGEDKG